MLAVKSHVDYLNPPVLNHKIMGEFLTPIFRRFLSKQGVFKKLHAKSVNFQKKALDRGEMGRYIMSVRGRTEGGSAHVLFGPGSFHLSTFFLEMYCS